MQRAVIVGVIIAVLLVGAGYLAWQQLAKLDQRINELNGEVAALTQEVGEAEKRALEAEERALEAEQRGLETARELSGVEEEARALQVEAREANERAQAAAEDARQSQLSRDAAEAAKKAAEARREDALSQAEKARQEAERARREAEEIERRRARERRRLQDALAKIVETRETALGVVMNLGSDHIEFDFDRAELRPENRELLSRIAGVLLTADDFHIQVFGHTDDVGTDEYNQELSERRAQTVHDYLVEAGLPAEVLSTQGFGKTKPLVEGTTPESRQRNRRVEIAVIQSTVEYQLALPENEP